MEQSLLWGGEGKANWQKLHKRKLERVFKVFFKDCKALLPVKKKVTNPFHRFSFALKVKTFDLRTKGTRISRGRGRAKEQVKGGQGNFVQLHILNDCAILMRFHCQALFGVCSCCCYCLFTSCTSSSRCGCRRAALVVVVAAAVKHSYRRW